jgi:hypothetical protein
MIRVGDTYVAVANQYPRKSQPIISAIRWGSQYRLSNLVLLVKTYNPRTSHTIQRIHIGEIQSHRAVRRKAFSAVLRSANCAESFGI